MKWTKTWNFDLSSSSDSAVSVSCKILLLNVTTLHIYVLLSYMCVLYVKEYTTLGGIME